MNAHEMYTALHDHVACEGLEDWLKDTLLPRMRDSANMTVCINTRDVEYSSGRFIRDMENLGYTISAECDDRPCAVPFYKISLVFDKFITNPR